MDQPLVLKWTTTLSTERLTEYRSGPYRIVGKGRFYGKKLVRSWKVYRDTTLIGEPSRLSEAKRDAVKDAEHRANTFQLVLRVDKKQANVLGQLLYEHAPNSLTHQQLLDLYTAARMQAERSPA